jgi:heterodisulfide reductase subunit C2
MNEVVIEFEQKTLRKRTELSTNENVSKCYQCGKCAAGCPLSDEMDLKPNQILRHLQQEYPGYEDEVLGAYSIWLCLTCQTCSARCPQEVDIPAITDYLRCESIRQNKVNPKAMDILHFHNSFLSSVKSNGKLTEVGLIRNYKLKTWHLMQDVMLAPQMFAKGKLKLGSHKIDDIGKIRRIFEKTEEQGGHQ